MMTKSRAQTMNSHRLGILIGLACLILDFSLPLAAQTNVTASLPPAAREAYDKGVVAAKLADYLLAIRYFEEARKTAPQSPEILFNLGLAESKISDRELRAICWFQAYLWANPASPNAAAVKEQVAMLDMKNQSNLSSLVRSLQDAVMQFPDPKNFERQYALKSVAVLWAKTGDFKTALQTADAIQDASNLKDDALRETALAQAKTGDMTGAQITLNLIQETRAKDDAQYNIATAQLEAGDSAGAVQTASHIQDASSRDRMYLKIIEAQAGTRNVTGAFQTFGFIQDTGYWQGNALKAIVKAQITDGKMAAAGETITRIRSAAIKGETQNLLVNAQIKTGNLEGAFQTANGIQDLRQQGSTLLDIFTAQLDAKKLDAAIQTVTLIRETNSKCWAQKDIATAQAETGNFEAAFKTTGEIVGYPRTKGIALGNITKAQAKAGDIPGAQKTAESIQDAIWKYCAFAYIAAAQANAGDVSGAKKTADRIPVQAPAVGSVNNNFDKVEYDYRNDAFRKIIEAQIKAGDITGAQLTLKSIQEVPASDPLRSQTLFTDYKSWAQREIGEAQALAGDITGAQITAGSTIDKYWQGVILEDVVKAQIHAGDLSGAQKTVDLIKDKGAKADAQGLIIASQPKPNPPPATTATPTRATPEPARNPWVEQNNYLLDNSVFIDLGAYLKSLPASDGSQLFNGIEAAADKIVDARQIITKMMKQPMKK